MDKSKALEVALAGITKQFGEGAVMKLGDPNARVSVSSIPTGCMAIDMALGIGGLPRGRIIEIYGPESSGKTTVTLHVIAETQKRGGTAAFIDAEHALDPQYAAKLGVNIDELYVSQPDNGEQALEICEALIRSNAIDIIVVDSVAALVPKSEIDGDMGAPQMGLHARLMSQALRKITAFVAKSNTVCVFINQVRSVISSGYSHGPTEITTGGKALKFYSSVRMEVRKAESIKNGSDVIGYHTKCKISKNKVAPPFKIAEFDIIFGEGISNEMSVLEGAEKLGVIKKSGTWYNYGDTRLGQGRDNARKFLKENPEICEAIQVKVREALTGGESK